MQLVKDRLKNIRLKTPYHTVLCYEILSHKMEGRLRKRSLRASESNGTLIESVRKRSRRLESPEEEPKLPEKPREKEKRAKKGVKRSLGTKKKKVDKNSPVQTSKNSLLVSLNIQDNALYVRKSDKGLATKNKGKSAVQRSDSVEVGSDFGSTVSSTGVGSAGKSTALNFKNPNFTFSSLASNKKKIWKNLKQLVTAEKSCLPGTLVSSYSSLDAPPSFNPARKYSDLSGFFSKYTDPLTRIYYCSSDEFQTVRTLPQDVIQGYLALRGKFMIT